MAAPTYVNAGTGASDTAGAWTYTCQASGAAGRVFIVQIVQDGTTTGQVLVTGGTNITNLAGTANAWTALAVDQPIGSPTTARHQLFIGRATGTGAPTISGSNAAGEDIFIRSVQFQNVNTGATLADVIENGTAGAILNGVGQTTGTATPPTNVDDQAVTTLGVDRLALNFVGINDDNSNTSLAGATGGTWQQGAPGSYVDSAGTDAGLNLFWAAMPAAGTINGGTGNLSFSLVQGWGVIGFALIGTTPSGPTTHFGATSSAYTFNRVIAAQRRTTSNLAMPVAFGAVVAGQVSVPAVTHYGALAAPWAFGAAVAAQRKTFGATANPYTFAKAVAGQRKTFGVTATPVTFSKAVAATRKTFGALAAPFTFGAVTAGIGTTGAVTHYGALTAPFTFAAVIQSRRRTTSSITAPFVFTATHAATRKAFGALTAPFVFGEVTQGRRRTTSSLVAPFVFTKDVRAQRRTTGQTATTITFGAVVASRKQYARTTTNLVFGEVTAGRKKTYGAIVRPFTFAAVTAGIGYTGAATYFGATTTTITFTKAVQGTKKTFGAVARPITFGAVVQGRRTTRTQIAAVYTWSSTTQAKRKTHATVAMPIQWLAVTRGVSTVGIQTYYGVVAAPFTFNRAVAAQRRTFSTTHTPITISAFTKGMLMANILNYADDIRWGTTQADRVMVGTTEVWTPGEDL